MIAAKNTSVALFLTISVFESGTIFFLPSGIRIRYFLDGTGLKYTHVQYLLERN
jgi:hypothetical protein